MTNNKIWMLENNIKESEVIEFEYIYSNFDDNINLLKKVHDKTKQLLPIELEKLNSEILKNDLKNVKFLSHKIIGPLRIFYKEDSLIMNNLIELENINKFDEDKINKNYKNICKLLNIGFEYLDLELNK